MSALKFQLATAAIVVASLVYANPLDATLIGDDIQITGTASGPLPATVIDPGAEFLDNASFPAGAFEQIDVFGDSFQWLFVNASNSFVSFDGNSFLLDWLDWVNDPLGGQLVGLVLTNSVIAGVNNFIVADPGGLDSGSILVNLSSFNVPPGETALLEFDIFTRHTHAVPEPGSALLMGALMCLGLAGLGTLRLTSKHSARAYCRGK